MRMNWQAAVLTLIFSTAASAETCSLSGLGWMIGNWKAVSSGESSHERWVSAPSGELIGFGWGPNHIHPGDVVRLSAISAEQGKLVLRQRHLDGALIHASEDKDDPIAYEATSCAATSITFEGVGKWKGGKVTYSSAGGVLTVEGNAHDNGPRGHYVVVLNRE